MFYAFYDVFEAVLNGLTGWLGDWVVALLCVAGMAAFLLARRARRGGDGT